MMNLKKKINFFLLIAVFFYGCGFEPVYNLKDSNFGFSKIETNKEKVSLNIKNNLKDYISPNGNKKKYNIKINLNQNRIIKSKNTKGEALVFSLRVSGNVLIFTDEALIRNIKINKFFDYQNDSNKFNLSEYEKNIENNLLSKITNEIIFDLIEISND